MAVALPEVKIGTTFFADEVCAVCGRDWDSDYPVPTAYTVESIEAGDLPSPVCDHCVEAHAPTVFADLMAKREYFWAN